jgi:hypothetical protein
MPTTIIPHNNIRSNKRYMIPKGQSKNPLYLFEILAISNNCIAYFCYFVQLAIYLSCFIDNIIILVCGFRKLQTCKKRIIYIMGYTLLIQKVTHLTLWVRIPLRYTIQQYVIKFVRTEVFSWNSSVLHQ